MSETLTERALDKQQYKRDLETNFGLVLPPQNTIEVDKLPKLKVPSELTATLDTKRRLEVDPNNQTWKRIITALSPHTILELKFPPTVNGGLAPLAYGVMLPESNRFAIIGEYRGGVINVLPEYSPYHPKTGDFRDDIESILFSATLLPNADYRLGHQASIVSDNHIFSVLGRFIPGEAKQRIDNLQEGQKSHAADLWKNRNGEELLQVVSENSFDRSSGVLPVKPTYLGPFLGNIPFKVILEAAFLNEEALDNGILTPRPPRILTPVEILKDIGYYRISQNETARSGVLKVLEGAQKNSFIV